MSLLSADVLAACPDLFDEAADQATYTSRDGAATALWAIVVRQPPPAVVTGEDGITSQARAIVYLFADPAQVHGGVASPGIYATITVDGTVWTIDRTPRRCGPLWALDCAGAAAVERVRPEYRRGP